MTDKEKIRAEIERRLDELNPKKGEFAGRPLRDVNPRTFPRESELEKLLSFIDSLSEEPVSDDLEEAAQKYAKSEYGRKKPATLPDKCRGCYALIMHAFKAGAQWQIHKDVEKKQ